MPSGSEIQPSIDQGDGDRPFAVTLDHSFARLRNYCEAEAFKGWDPYDGLNSGFFRSLPGVSHNRLCRLAWIQFFKRSPLNLRPILGVKKDFNPKGLGLFLSGYCQLQKTAPSPQILKHINELVGQLLDRQTPGYSGSCWGYNFDWQARAFFQPKHTPTVVASTFIGYALLDAFELTQDENLLKTARSICDFILQDLNRSPDDQGNFAFSYSPMDHTQVFNASLLGSRMLSRVYGHTREPELVEAARKSVQYCCNHQQDNGAWAYGTLPFHQWIDNFHTGYNLECIHEYQRWSGDTSFQSAIDKGFEFYLNTFFTAAGQSRYYNNALYPIDIHAPAQLVITLSRMGQLKNQQALVDRVLHWTIANMQDPQGYFYYQFNKGWNSRIPYMRWAQAWMFVAMCTYKSSMENPVI